MTARHRQRLRLAPAAVVLLLAGASLGQTTAPQGVATASAPPLTLVDLQAARRSQQVDLPGPGRQRGSLTLTALQPAVNAWFLLTLRGPGETAATQYHLENADPAAQRVALDPTRPGTLTLGSATPGSDLPGEGAAPCPLWPGPALAAARRSPLAYAPLCGGRLYLRNAVAGHRSTLEAGTELLRDHVWRGEQVIGFVRREFLQDAFAQRARPADKPGDYPGRDPPTGAPPPARLADGATPRAVASDALGLGLADAAAPLRLGQWRALAGLDGIYLSAALPRALAAGAGAAARPLALDPVEGEALALLVAFDLSAFELGFALGTEHPRLGWSARVPPALRPPALPGPDGIASAAPLVRTGQLAPALQARAVATFTGGFKREHGAFRHGALATVNRGSHYGFIEQGVVFSRLQPGLATLYVGQDGEVGMTTWRSEDDAGGLGRLRHARQNGVPLLERDPGGGTGRPGALIDQWGAGNWSGSADERLRTLRAGACLVEAESRRFLVYGYFSTATPRAMARVFQAYACRYAMHLDMNALEHTYLALYPRSGAQIGVEHLVSGMAALDKQAGGALVPRFLGYADDRDFFYLLTKAPHR